MSVRLCVVDSPNPRNMENKQQKIFKKELKKNRANNYIIKEFYYYISTIL